MKSHREALWFELFHAELGGRRDERALVEVVCE